MRIWFLAFGVTLTLGFGCTETKTSCDADADCDTEGTGFRICLVEEGICGCSDDRGCADDEFCNASGRCQVRTGCVSNDQCVTNAPDRCSNQFCDVQTGECVGICNCGSEEQCCTQDSHCPFKSICNAFEGQCEPGCRSDGDCLLGEGCTGAGLAGQIGQCERGVCTANNQCGFGQICNLGTGECTVDVRGPYCAGCAGGIASDDCGEPANYCLIDPSGAGEFCGVDCSLDQACPFGYQCQQVIILPPSAPTCIAPETCNNDVCSRTAAACTIDEDCPEGPPQSNCPRGDTGTCLQNQTQDCLEDSDCCDGAECPEGSCVKQVCRGGEGAAIGSCTCTRDLDCPRDSCSGADNTDPQNPILGNCELSGAACAVDDDCDTIACVNGGCLIGSNCAPANDRVCSDLLAAP